MTITGLKAQVKNPERVSVYVDESYAFSLTQSQLLASGLRIGKEISEAELEKLKKDSELGKAYMRALDYIMRRVRSEKEMRDYAWRKKWEPEMTEQVIAKLKEKNYLNDENFARLWVKHRAMGKPISQKKLKLELRQKGIETELIDEALAASQDFNEPEALKALIEKKRSRYPDELKFKQYLAQQGFNYDDIKQALED